MVATSGLSADFEVRQSASARANASSTVTIDPASDETRDDRAFDCHGSESLTPLHPWRLTARTFTPMVLATVLRDARVALNAERTTSADLRAWRDLLRSELGAAKAALSDAVAAEQAALGIESNYVRFGRRVSSDACQNLLGQQATNGAR